MEHRPAALTALSVLGLAWPASAGHVSVFLGSPGQPGSVKVFEETGASAAQFPALLQGIQLEPIDFAGRTELNSFLPGRPRRLVDVPGASRLTLPAGQGSLYAYRRPAAGVFGFMLIDAGGVARSVWELAGLGAAGDVSPFLDRLAISPEGDELLIATTPAAGGDLWSIALADGSANLRTASLPSQDFNGAGLALGLGFGAAITAGGILRFDRNDVLEASPVGVSNSSLPSWWLGEIVLSNDGAFAATVGGAAPDQAHVFVLDDCNPAIQVSPAPQSIAGAGFQPEWDNGPFLAVSDDGTRAAWVALETVPESYLAIVPQSTSVGDATHVTQDGIFNPFLDEIGIYGFIPGNRLIFTAGDQIDGVPGHIRQGDVFMASLVQDGFSVANVSQTTGTGYPPFGQYGELEPLRACFSPDQHWLFMHSGPDGAGSLSVICAFGHGILPSTLATDVQSLDALELNDATALYSIVREDAVTELESNEVYLAPFGFDVTPTLLMPIADEDPAGAAAMRPDGMGSLVTPAPNEQQFLWRIDGVGGTATKFTNRLFEYGTTLALTSTGGIAASIGEPGHLSVFFVWPQSGPPKRLQAQLAVGFVLP